MEKLFRPNKWFVLFCGFLIAVWLGLQYVSNARIEEASKVLALEIFDWSWPEKVSSKVEITGVSILNKGENEAKVRVKGKQEFVRLSNDNSQKKEDEGNSSAQISPTESAVVLTLYRSNRNWVLGKVEFD
jgi:hypothetical protein